MCEFRLLELEVFNFRKFEHEIFKLNPQMNVFIGKNGSGKTAILEAAGVMLGAYLRSVYKELHADHETGAADNK